MVADELEYVVTVTVRSSDRAAAVAVHGALRDVVHEYTDDNAAYTGVTVELDTADGNVPWTTVLAHAVADEVATRLAGGEKPLDD